LEQIKAELRPILARIARWGHLINIKAIQQPAAVETASDDKQSEKNGNI
jgi:hypothetical protein